MVFFVINNMSIKTKLSTRQQRIKNLKNKDGSQNGSVLGNTVVKHDSPKRRMNVVENIPMIREDFSPPLWLKGLIFLQKSSSILSFSVISLMLFLYGMTVYAPQLWTAKFNNLNKLQKDERQMTSTNEIVKEDLMKQINTNGTGLVNPDPKKIPIFLPETSVNPLKIKENNSKSVIHPPEVLHPIAY